MNCHKTFIQSFRKLNRNLLFFALLDGAFVTLISLVYWLITSFLAWKSEIFANGMSAEQIQQFMVTATAEQLQSFLSEMKILLFEVFGLYLLFIILVIFSFALSQALIWHLAVKKKFNWKYIFKWALFSLLMLPVFVLTLFVFLAIKLAVLYLLQSINDSVYVTLNQFFNLMYLVAFLYLFFLLCRQLAHTQKIGLAFHEVSKLIRSKFKPLACSYLFTLLVAVIISVLSVILFTYLPALQSYLLYIQLAVSILFLAWLRLYLVEVTKS